MRYTDHSALSEEIRGQYHILLLKIRHRAPARSVCGFRLLSSQLDSSKILDSELELLLEDSKDPPKTATAVDLPLRRPTLEASLRPQSASRRLQDPSRRLQDGSKMPPEASKTPSDASKTPQDASKRPPRPSKIDFLSWNPLSILDSKHNILLEERTVAGTPLCGARDKFIYTFYGFLNKL